jgi:hypothetical protein
MTESFMRKDGPEYFGFDPNYDPKRTHTNEGSLELLKYFPFDFPIITPPFSIWAVWPGVDPRIEIPANATLFYSHVYLAKIPRSSGQVSIAITGPKVKIWRYIGIARNGYNSDANPGGPYMACGTNGCLIGWSSWFNPIINQNQAGVATANYTFSTWSNDYDRYCYWIALATTG